MIKKISNPIDEVQAQKIIETILPTPHIRDIGLSIISDGIIEANFHRRNNWAVTNVYSERVWFQVGHYATVTLENDSIWLALDKQLIENPIEKGISFSSANKFGWNPGNGSSQFKDKHKPGRPFSINGYYIPPSFESHQEIWPYMRRLFFEFIFKAEYIGQSTMLPATKRLHIPGILMYIRNKTGKHLPDPLYS
jgi:hypothetical protein